MKKEEKLLLAVGLPCVARGNQLLIEVYGNQRVIIENHSGVAAYHTGEIIVNARKWDVHIVGSNLALAKMSGCQLVICGEIASVTYEKVGAV